MRKIALTMLAVLLFCGCEGKELKSKSNPEAEKAATESAELWLRLVDTGRYAESWEQTAGYFKTSITKEAWQKYFQWLREPLGRPISRKMISCKYTTSLPRVPKGEYVVIQYISFFEKKRDVVETVTPVLDKDGKWRVSGYFIK